MCTPNPEQSEIHAQVYDAAAKIILSERRVTIFEDFHTEPNRGP